MKYLLVENSDNNGDFYNSLEEATIEMDRMIAITNCNECYPFNKVYNYEIIEYTEEDLEIWEFVYGYYSLPFNSQEAMLKAMLKEKTLLNLANELTDKVYNEATCFFKDNDLLQKDWVGILEDSILKNTLSIKTFENFINNKKGEYHSILNFIKDNDEFLNSTISYDFGDVPKYELSGYINLDLEGNYDDNWGLTVFADKVGEGEEREVMKTSFLTASELHYFIKKYHLEKLEIKTRLSSDYSHCEQ